MSPRPEPRCFAFGDFTIDIQKRELKRLGEPVRLVGKPFDVLAYLIRNRDRVVPAEELFHAVWKTDAAGERVFDPDYIQQAIAAIRRILGDKARNPMYVHTDRGRGIRFVAPVEISPPQARPGHRPSKLAWYGAVVGTLAALSLILLAYSGGRPEIIDMTAITHSGFRKFAPVVEYDGGIYFSEFAFDHYRVVRLDKSTHESTVVQSSVPDPYLCDIHQKTGALLLRSVRGGFDDYGPMYVQHRGINRADPLPIVAFDGVWGPNGKSIVFGRDGDIGRFDLVTANTEVLAHVDGYTWWPRWNPSQDRLRFTVTDPKGQLTSIWEVRADGKGLRRLFDPNDPWGRAGCGSWTPDGRHFIFQVGPLSNSTIWEKDERILFTFKRPVQLTSGPSYRGPQLSADGRTLLARAQIYRGELRKVDPKTGVESALIPQAAADIVSISPQGNTMVYVVSPESTLWLSRLDGSGTRVLVRDPIESAFPSWSPRGDRIAVSTRRAGMPWRISIVAPESGQLHTFDQINGNAVHPTWSHDGKRILFGTIPTIEKNPYIYVLYIENGTFTPIPGSQGLFTPSWSPSGRYIAALRGDSYDLVLFDFETGRWSILAQSKFGYPVWSKDERYVYSFQRDDGGPRIFRVHVADRKLEQVLYLPGFRLLDRWMGVHADGSLLLAKDIGVQEIFSMRFAQPLR